MSFVRPTLGLLSAVAVAAAAMAPAPAAAKPENGKRFGDWVVECEQTPKGERCAVSQTAMKDGNRVLTVTVGYLGAKGEPVLLAIVPLGISLVAGAAFKIGDAKEVPMQMQQCTVQGCLAVGQMAPAHVKALNDGKSLGIGVVPAGTENIVGLPVSMNGFKDAFASLK
ncbi:MAG: invasion associated locus B family protein [Actinomycetota bacterium]